MFGKLFGKRVWAVSRGLYWNLGQILFEEVPDDSF
jgi:hypothetical protein